MRLLVDHNLPPRLAVALHAIFEPDHEVRSLRDSFGRSDLTDEAWIEALGSEGGWAVLSKDMNIARKKPSRDLFMSAGLVGFFFSPAMQKWPLTRYAARNPDGMAGNGDTARCRRQRCLRDSVEECTVPPNRAVIGRGVGVWQRLLRVCGWWRSGRDVRYWWEAVCPLWSGVTR